MGKVWLGIAALVLGFAVALPDAEARRLGGGRTLGAQRNITAPPPAAAPAKQASPAAPAQQGSRMLPILGGLAIGAFLGAMFADHPIMSTLLTAMLAGFLAFVALAVFRALRAPQSARAAPQPLQYAGLGNETVAAPPPSQSAGFDARTFGGGAAPRANVPAGFDVAGFLRAAKSNFIRLQIANDNGNLEELREVTTPEMFEALRQDTAAGQQTDVVTLNADLLEVATEGARHWASVRFTGLVREAPGAEPAGFEEVWNLAKPVDGSTGWVLAGIQQMH
ncbi:MAG TPA: Tim44-like domain-containing protein [Burkholderiales bacterium]|nr:Tim44-like domain-containing protein [Burkholderiales bacterium]